MTMMLKLKFIFSIPINSEISVYSKVKLGMHLNVSSMKK